MFNRIADSGGRSVGIVSYTTGRNRGMCGTGDEAYVAHSARDGSNWETERDGNWNKENRTTWKQSTKRTGASVQDESGKKGKPTAQLSECTDTTHQTRGEKLIEALRRAPLALALAGARRARACFTQVDRRGARGRARSPGLDVGQGLVGSPGLPAGGARACG